MEWVAACGCSPRSVELVADEASKNWARRSPLHPRVKVTKPQYKRVSEMRDSTNSDPKRGYFARLPSFIRTMQVVFVAAASAAPLLSSFNQARAHELKVVDGKTPNDVASTGNGLSKFQYFKPFSKEWEQRREQEARRLKAATTICRC